MSSQHKLLQNSSNNSKISKITNQTKKYLRNELVNKTNTLTKYSMAAVCTSLCSTHFGPESPQTKQVACRCLLKGSVRFRQMKPARYDL